MELNSSSSKSDFYLGLSIPDWDCDQIIPAIPRVQNLPPLATLNGKNLDVFISNLGSFYTSSIVVSPVEPDHPSRGKKSDHSVPFIYLLDTHSIKENNIYTKRTTRQLPDSGIWKFGETIMCEGWEEVRPEESSSQQDEALQAVLGRILDNCLPTKTVPLRNTDKPFMTNYLKKNNKKRRREYIKHGKSPKYLNLRNIYHKKFSAASQNFLNINVRALLETEPGKAYCVLRRLGARPGDSTDASTFQLHVELGLTAAQWADRIAQKFVQIS